MDAMTKVIEMFKEANASYAGAKNAGDEAAATAIDLELIQPLKNALAGIALAEVHAHAAQLDAVSAKVETALATLQRRINRLFIDRLIEKARNLDLVTEVAVTPPSTPTTTTSTSTEPGAANRINVTPTDLDALARLAASEVGHFGRYGPAQLHGGLAAVVDTVFNRVAHSRFPNSIEAVIDQPKQFSALDSVGSWTGLPDAPASIAQLVADHVTERARGAASEIDGATHFLNPYLSSASAMESWGRHVKENAIKVYGSDADKDVCYHGYAPGYGRPDAHTIALRSTQSHFDTSGRVPGGPPSNGDIRAAVVRISRDQIDFFDGGKAAETDDPQYLRVGEFWKAVGSANNGRTTNANGKRPAWSAAFVSYVLKTAGAGSRFQYASAHCHYFQYFVDRAGPALYEAGLASDVVPQPGDIVHYGREYASQFGFADARSAYGDDGRSYPSHSAIVVSVDRDAGKLKTIGGNESDSVREATYALDSDGHLKPREKGGKTFPWIGVLRMV